MVDQENIEVMFGHPLAPGLTTFYATVTVRAPASAGRAGIERRAAELLAAVHAVLPPVKRWRVEPEINSDGDFETDTAVAIARSRGWLEHYNYTS